MDGITQVINKENEICHQNINSRYQKIGRRRPCSVLVLSVLTLAFAGTIFMEKAASHTSPDHEIEDQTQAILKEPERPDLWITRSQYYRSNGNFVQALNDLEQAGELDPENIDILLERGLTLSALGRDVEAEVELDRFLEEESSNSLIALVERGHIRARTGREDLAIDDFTHAIHLQPAVGLYMARGQAQETLGDLEAAASGYREGLSHMGDNVSLKRALIRIEKTRHQYDEALRLIDEELARVKIKSPWYLARAELLALKGQVKAAKRDRKKALVETNRALGKRPTALHRMYRAKVYIAMGRLEDAKRDLQLAVQVAPYLAEAEELLTSLEGR